MRDAEDSRKVSEMIKALNGKDVLIIVEGMKDRKVLRALGYTGDIFEISGSGGGYSKLVQRVRKYSRIILLLDTDKKGRKLEEGVKRRFNGTGINLDLNFRRKLKVAARGFTHVEELSRFVKDESGFTENL
jgi:5S rRNA maturation endonuclease (ribonuclease M5)